MIKILKKQKNDLHEKNIIKKIFFVKSNVIIISVILLIVVIFSFFFIKKSLLNSERNAYEKFIKNKSEKFFSEIKNEDKKENLNIKEEEKEDNPEIAAFQEYITTMDPNLKRIPRERLIAAYNKTIDLQNKRIASKKSPTLAWRNIPTVMGGRTRTIMFDPNDSNHKKVWAGAVTGGLWYNNNITIADSAWHTVNDFWSNLSISCMAYDPINTNIFYLGTGEVETAVITYRESSGVGTGIWKSTDGGQNWTLMQSTLNFAYITDIDIRNENGTSVIYAGVASGKYHGEHQSTPSDGLFRSVDGGNTWNQVLPNITGTNVPYAVSDIAIGANGRIYVGTMANLNNEGAAVILYSDLGTNSSWTVNESYRNAILNDVSAPIPGRVMIANAPSDSNIVYAIIGSGYTNTDNGFNYFNAKYILKSSNKGVNWQEIDNPSNGAWATLAWHAFTLGVDPNNPNHVWIGGLDLWKSSDGGTSWSKQSDWSLQYNQGGDQYVHADQHAIVFKPGSSNEMMFASDGGIFYTFNGNTNLSVVFQERNNRYNTLQFYTCDINTVESNSRYVGGLQDNGTLLHNGAPLSNYSQLSGGDGAYCFFDKLDTSQIITTVYYNRINLFTSFYQTGYIGQYQSGVFINPMDYDSELKTLYANAVDYVGNNTDKLLRISDLFVNNNGEFINANTGSSVYFSNVKLSPNSPQGTSTLFLGSISGRIFKMTNAQSNNPVTTEIGSNNFPIANISCIEVGGSDDTLMVIFSNYGVQSVWQTCNGGQTWNDKEGNLPDMPIRWALYYPGNSNKVLLATEIGIWETDNINQQNVIWEPDINGMANVRVDMLRIRKSDKKIIAATHGRGLYTATYDISTSTKTTISENDVFITPNPSNGIFDIKINNSYTKNINVIINDVSGKIILNEKFEKNNNVFFKEFNLSSCPKGNYIINIVFDNKSKIVKKIILI